MLVQSIINGFLIGGVYALVAVGLNLMFGVMKFVNFAHGEFLMAGMYVAVGLAAFAPPHALFGIYWVALPTMLIISLLLHSIGCHQAFVISPAQTFATLKRWSSSVAIWFTSSISQAR